MMNNIKTFLKSNPHSHLFFMHIKNIISKFKCSIISDEKFIKRKYFHIHKTELNLTNPRLFNEKIQWLKLNYRKNILTLCADKYAVREYVANMIGKEVLNELYACYNDVEEIDLSLLPEKFIMKVTHGSGQNLIITDKHNLNWPVEKKLLNFFMHSNHYLEGREWQYKNIPPRIICEKYLNEDGGPPIDYKIFCFNGDPQFIQLDRAHTRSMYDVRWNMLPFGFGSAERSLADFKRPLQLELMLTYARKLAGDFPFARIDFYLINNKIIFGEITFHPAQGLGKFIPESYNMVFGKHLKLPIKS